MFWNVPPLGTRTDDHDLLAQVATIGPILDRNAQADEAAGELTRQAFNPCRPCAFPMLSSPKLWAARNCVPPN
jgi:hypothetical protein